MTENETKQAKNRAVLVGLNAHCLSAEENADDTSMEELADLLETAGGVCVGTVFQNKDAPDPRTFIGEGKAAEVKELVGAMGADMVVVDNPLSPSQQRVLSEELGVQVLDRAALILDIFAQRARTREGRLQVELAQYQYLLPRLLGMWTHLERQEGAIGTRGPGETQLETDRRHIRRKIQKLREELAQRGYFLSSANSINWGRVLPQVVYYISAYCDLLREGRIQKGERINVCVPTGNFGNILAAYYAREMGVPIGRLICASNSNNVLTDFLCTGVYDRNRTFYNTMSPSMDILISSNLERLLFSLSNHDDAEARGYMEELARSGRYEVSPAIKGRLEKLFAAGFCDDAQTQKVIGRMWQEHRYLIDPHTAVAFDVLDQYRRDTGDTTPTVVVSTASPFKFCDSVLGALGVSELAAGTAILDQLSQQTGVPVPAPLAALKDKTVRFGRSVTKEHMVDQVLEMLR